ncbi:hypothetical protein CMV_025817 [Castanea mollissima]|uniref:Uncharacterized protein n=1 Tax=Castanea mollissima TaxID=60419 RepID=A0A8J4Q8S7_9ROSI|nr:hypothetical protein CMV_025817 [Castanea mollissima]
MAATLCKFRNVWQVLIFGGGGGFGAAIFVDRKHEARTSSNNCIKHIYTIGTTHVGCIFKAVDDLGLPPKAASEVSAVTMLDYSKKMKQLCREAYLLKKDQVIKLRGVLWTWHVGGKQGWQLLVMQDVIRDEVGKVHACFARTE